MFALWLSLQRIFGEASEKNLYLSQLIILDTLNKCLAGVSLPHSPHCCDRQILELMWCHLFQDRWSMPLCWQSLSCRSCVLPWNQTQKWLCLLLCLCSRRHKPLLMYLSPINHVLIVSGRFIWELTDVDYICSKSMVGLYPLTGKPATFLYTWYPELDIFHIQSEQLMVLLFLLSNLSKHCSSLCGLYYMTHSYAQYC